MRGPFPSSSVSSARGIGLACRAGMVTVRSHVFRSVYPCLLALVPLGAAQASNVLTGPAESSKDWYGFEIGPTFSLPLPAASANRDELGLDVGLSFTAMPTQRVGFGANVAYHYWLASADLKQGFNEFLSAKTLNILKLGGGTWGLQVVQFGGHFRFAAPTASGVRPWLQVGASAYGVDPNTTGYSGDAGFFTVTASPLQRTYHYGYSVAVGTDLIGGRSARMGLDATYHFVGCSEQYGEDLQVFTLGVHVLFGW